MNSNLDARVTVLIWLDAEVEIESIVRALRRSRLAKLMWGINAVATTEILSRGIIDTKQIEIAKG